MNTPNVEVLCDQGDQCLARAEWGEAVTFFREALSTDEKSKRALLGLAVALKTGRYDYEHAQRLLNRCLYHHPRDPDALTEQGRLLAEQGDHSKAVVFFDQALIQNGAKREALQGKIRSLLAQGHTADAHQFVESIARTASPPPWLLCELALVLLAQGSYDAAVEAFLDAGEQGALYLALAEQSEKAAKDALAGAILAREGRSAEALEAVAAAHRNWGDLNAAVEAYSQLIQLRPKDEAAHLQLIDLLRTQERFSEAEAVYENAVQSLGRASDSLLLARARVLFERGMLDQGAEALAQLSDQSVLLSFLEDRRDADAIHTFDVLLDRQPLSARLLKSAASRLAAAGNAGRALEMLERALGIDPKDIDAVVAKGRIFLDQGKLEDLDSLLKRAKSAFGTDQSELVSLEASLLLARANYAQAVRLAVSGGRETDILSYVDALLTAGDVTDAEKLVNAAVSEYPNSIAFLEAHGKLLTQQGRYDDAAALWSAIHQKQPDNSDALLQQTHALRRGGRYEEAAQVIDRAIRRTSSNERRYLFTESGLVLYAQGRYNDAVQQFVAALAVAPDYWLAHLWRIRALRISGRPEEAEAAIKHALATERLPGQFQAEIVCEMGELHEAREQWKAAIGSYAEARRVYPKLVEPYFREAAALLRLNLNDDAEHLVETILKERGTENEVKERAGWYYLSKKDFRGAEAQFQEILSRAPSDLLAINGLGGMYFEQGRFDLAEQMFRRALAIEQRDAVLWTNLAWALVRHVSAADSGQEPLLAEAERHCRKAIQLAPKHANAHACLGIIAFRRGRLMDSEDLLKHAIHLDRTGSAYSDLGALYAHLGRYEDAQKVLETGRELDRYDGAVRVELGNVYLQLGRTRDAIAVLKEACAINPQAEEPVRALSIAQTKAGDLLDAVRVLRSAIRTQDRSSSPSLRVALCRVLTELGEKTDDSELYAEALKEVRLAIAVQPNNPDVYFHAGIVCFKQRDYRAAHKHFKQCRELDNNRVEAEQAMRKAKALKWQETERARGGFWLGSTIGIVCFGLLIVLWSIYLSQPVPETQDAIRRIDSAMLLTLSPLLLALVFVALLMPWLSKLKLPGGVEAELTQPKEQISSGPSGPLTVSLGTSTISAGPR